MKKLLIIFSFVISINQMIKVNDYKEIRLSDGSTIRVKNKRKKTAYKVEVPKMLIEEGQYATYLYDTINSVCWVGSYNNKIADLNLEMNEINQMCKGYQFINMIDLIRLLQLFYPDLIDVTHQEFPEEIITVDPSQARFINN